MSTICITNHNEHICNLVKDPAVVAPARACAGCPSYISKHRPRVLRDEKRVKECHRTFGFSSVPLPRPCEFLRKNSRIVPAKPAAGHKCHLSCRRPPLPSCPAARCVPRPDPNKLWEESWKKGKGRRYCIINSEVPAGRTEQDKQRKDRTIHCGKNFISENIHKAVCSVPRHPRPKFVDTKKGDTQSLLKSGLLPAYIHKKNYGRVPAYVCGGSGPVCATEVVCEKPIACPVSEGERVKLLEGLRYNWAELQKAYQLLPVLTDTLHRRIRKECMEKELRQLEHDIRTIERHAHIYVVNDGCVP